MRPEIFIGHSIEDKALGDTLYSLLESEGIGCRIASWGAPLAAAWEDPAKADTRDSQAAVLIVSANEIVPPEVLRLVARAVTEGVAVIPFRIGNRRAPKEPSHCAYAGEAADALTPGMRAQAADLVRKLRVMLSSVDMAAEMFPGPDRMRPCRIEFHSSTVRGGDLDGPDRNAGELLLVYTSPNGWHSEPISFFPNDVSFDSLLGKLAPLIARFSGVAIDRLSLFATDGIEIWLPTVARYREQLLGKVKGCGVNGSFPYEAYSFGFTPNSFFFDADVEDCDPYSRKRKKLPILESAKPCITSAYRSLMGGSTVPRNTRVEEFFLEECPMINADWLCWQGYFTSTSGSIE